MKVLGISCGRRMSNTEIMVKEALMGAEEAGAEVQFLRLQDYYIKPCTGCNSCVVDLMEKGGGGACVLKNDDFPFIDDLIMECDGLILGSPIYEKSPTGQLKSLEDRMGPSHDQGFRIIAQKIRDEKGITTGTGPDPRAFKPRAASLIAVGGSEWDTLALPVMSLFALTMQIEVVDNGDDHDVGVVAVVVGLEALAVARGSAEGGPAAEGFRQARGGVPGEGSGERGVHRRARPVPDVSRQAHRDPERQRPVPGRVRSLRRARHPDHRC